MTERSALVIMARYPAVGAVKTRLARVIGAERATALYRAFLYDLDARFGALRRELVWAYTPPDADFPSLVGARRRCMPQLGDDLAARMFHCFRTLCGERFGAVIMIGADVPHVRDAWIDEAEARLADAEVVLGPSHDGGYYLVAMRRPHDLFGGMEMSTDRVLTETLCRAAHLGLRVHLLPPTFDVDEPADLRRLHALLQHRQEGDLNLPCTWALLREWEGETS